MQEIITDDFDIIPIGEKEMWVYDIEVEDNHNFFANDILIHNSIMVSLDYFVSGFCNEKDDQKIADFIIKFSDEIIDPFIDKSYKELAEYTGCKENKMHMKREKVFKSGFWTAKKRYALMIIDNEGTRYQQPKLSVTGLDSKRSTISPIGKKFQEDTYKYILNVQNAEKVLDYVRNIKKQWDAEISLDEISITKSVKELSKYADDEKIYTKGCPMHFRAALLYNHYLEKFNLTTTYEKIQQNDKLMYVKLKTPNPIKENVIAYKTEIPKEFGLDGFYDSDKQFDDNYKNGVDSILESLGWRTNQDSFSVASFFG